MHARVPQCQTWLNSLCLSSGNISAKEVTDLFLSPPLKDSPEIGGIEEAGALWSLLFFYVLSTSSTLTNHQFKRLKTS